MKKFGVLSFMLVIVCSFLIPSNPAHAATVTVISYPSMAGDCSTTLQIAHNITIAGTTTDIGAPNRDVVALVLYDGGGNAFAYIGISITVGFSATLPSQTWNYPILVQPQSRPFTMRIYDNTTVVTTGSADLVGAQHGTLLDTVNFDPIDYTVCTTLPTYTPPTGPTVQGAQPFADGRINNWDMAAPVAVYGHDFASDHRGLVIYSNEGALLLQVHPDDLINCPTTNTLIIRAKGISLYQLSSCEYQITTTTLDGTKTYNLIFKSFYPNTGYISYEA